MMKSQISILAIVTALVLDMRTAEAAKFVLPKNATNMSALAVSRIYADHTWKWGSGGAYFGPNRIFYAVSGEGKSLNIAAGRWLVTKGGRLCFNADWSSRQNVFKNIMTCFNHAEYRGNYYQAKGLSGRWYSIKSAKPSPQDMIRLIVSGDQVGCLYLDSARKLKHHYLDSARKLKHHLSARQTGQLAKLKKAKSACPVGKQAAAK